MEIGTFIEHSVDHELSGNIIDLCPVGALNSKPFRFRGRGWEMTQHALLSPHDGVGTQLYGHVLRGRLMRVVPRECEAINETWIADRDRFSYEGIYAEDRLLSPQLRQPDGSWREVEWDVALGAAAQSLSEAAGADAGLGLLAHPSSTLEELYLLARLAAGLGSPNIDHRLRQRDFRDQSADTAAPGLGLPIAQIDALDALLLVGANLRHEVPILAHRVRKAALRGARIHAINPARFELLFPLGEYVLAPPAAAVHELAAVLAAALGTGAPPAALVPLLQGAAVTPRHQAIAQALGSGAQRAIWLGALALRSAQASELRALARALSAATGAVYGELAEGGNAAGGYLAGALPHRAPGGVARAASGLHARAMLEQPLAGYLLLHCEPWADAVYPEALETLARSTRVVAITPFASEAMKRVAQVLLPAGTFAESSGSYVNLEGRWQSQAGAAHPVGAARPAWKILRVLGNLLALSGFEYQSSEQVRDELQALIAAAPAARPAASVAPLTRAAAAPVPDVPMYQIDPVLRRAAALLRTRDGLLPLALYGGDAA
jgi:NADH-quinone oxidoreductase subunit G